jgi:hypothetical protein
LAIHRIATEARSFLPAAYFQEREAAMQRIDKPGIYDLSDDLYHSDPVIEPSLSSSIGKILLTQTPLHAKLAHPRLNPDWKSDQDSKFDIGSAAHDWLLRGADKMQEVKADDWRTKAAKEQRDSARASGLIPLLSKDIARVKTMVEAVQAQLENHREASDAFKKGMPEQTLIWQEEIGDVRIWCRAKVDWLPDDGGFLYDYKTTTDAAAPEFRKRLFDLGHDISIAFYRRGLAKLRGGELLEPRFVVVEVSPPHAVNVIGLVPSALEYAEMKVDEMLRRWAYCISRGVWGGYAPYVSLVDAPPWIMAQFEERIENRKALRDVAARSQELSADFIDRFGV